MPRAKRAQTEIAKATSTRALVYARVSTKEQRDEGYSISSQISTLVAYCQSKQLEIAEIIIEAETAKESGRPEFNRMLGLIRSGSASAIVVEKTDRLYRNKTDRVAIEVLNPDVHLVKESTIISRTSRSHDLFIHDIKLAVAENYINNLREETKKGMLAKAQSGIWPTHAPLGYQNVLDGQRRVIALDSSTSPQILHIFTLYATGDYSFQHLADVARKIGLRNRNSKPLGKSGIQAILRNPIHAGIVKWNGIEYAGAHSPIVPKALWEKCQDVMEGRNPTKVARTRSVDFIYRGLLRCSCGCLMSPYLAKQTYVYYACSGAKGCKRTNYREESISSQFSALLERLILPSRLIEIVRRELKDSFSVIRAEDARTTEFLTKRKAKLKTSLESLYMDKLTGDVAEELFNSMKARIQTELREVDEDIVRAEAAAVATWEQTASFVEMVSNLSARFNEAENTEKRVMFESAVSNSQIIDGKLVIEPEFWFKAMLKLTSSDLEKTSENDVRTRWLPAVDSNHD